MIRTPFIALSTDATVPLVLIVHPQPVGTVVMGVAEREVHVHPVHQALVFHERHPIHLLVQTARRFLRGPGERLPFRKPGRVRLVVRFLQVLRDVVERIRRRHAAQELGGDSLGADLLLGSHPVDEALVERDGLRAEDGWDIQLVEGVVAGGAAVASARLGFACVAPFAAGAVDADRLLVLGVGGAASASCAGCWRGLGVSAVIILVTQGTQYIVFDPRTWHCLLMSLAAILTPVVGRSFWYVMFASHGSKPSFRRSM